jgi:uncharacterized LabA/DUF88 family protein
MEPKRTSVYIDGLNFYYGALKGSGNKWLDLEALVKVLLPRDEIVAIRYFTAVVNARPDDPRIPVRQDAYLRALDTLSLVTIHRGRFTTRVRSRVLADSAFHHSELFTPHFRPKPLFSALWRDSVSRRTSSGTSARVVIDEEKGSDVNLGVHLVNDAAQGLMQKALVISNDSDLTEGIVLARNFGVAVGVLNPHDGQTSRHLRESASFEMPFRRQVLGRCQFPSTVHAHKRTRNPLPEGVEITQRPVLSNGPRAQLPKHVGRYV